MMLIVSLGFLACIILKDPLCIFCFSFCFLLYLNERFHSKRILIVFMILSLFSIVLVKPCKEAEKEIILYPKSNKVIMSQKIKGQGCLYRVI